jgi:hypothetical protein
MNSAMVESPSFMVWLQSPILCIRPGYEDGWFGLAEKESARTDSHLESGFLLLVRAALAVFVIFSLLGSIGLQSLAGFGRSFYNCVLIFVPLFGFRR